MLALVRLRRDPLYRREAFEHGLERAGYRVIDRGHPTSKRDFLCIWNRKPSDEAEASAWERAGGTVLVAENGYVGRDGEGRQNYALSAHAHNGAGWFPVGSEDRFAALGIEPQPWRKDGAHVLICAQRGIGSRQMASPPNWHIDAAKRLLRVGTRATRTRLHPGLAPPATTLEQDLAGAWACAIWSSGSGVKALLAGIPVFYDAPHWICEGAAVRGLDDIEHPLLSDVLRLEALKRMAHAQWSVAELETGEPFVRMREGLGA
jgi:hypothetical protein